MSNERDPGQTPEIPVRTLSPGALTAKRFLRNRLAAAGLWILLSMFLFSFLGGAVIPYGQDQVFYRQELQKRKFAGVSRNETFRFLAAPEQTFGAVLQAQFNLVRGKADSFTYADQTYTLIQDDPALYRVLRGDTPVAIAYTNVIEPVGSFDFTYHALSAYGREEDSFFADGKRYAILQGVIRQEGTDVAHISPYAVQSAHQGQPDSAFRQAVTRAVETGANAFAYTDDRGENRNYSLEYDAAGRLWTVYEQTPTRVWDSYAAPSAAHPLGTDKNGMDVLTRLMYGGRVSLVIGFVVVLISGALGVVLGGTAGYFGGWTDQLIMRTVDVFYCVPSTPLLIILGAAMDSMRVEPQLRMLFLMLVLGLLGWPELARLIRGQILSLREQEFMTAAEACGLRTTRRIFRHLIPNAIPQLIVSCTMRLGSTILTEATLSFLGLGVKFPFASWGNIMNDVTNAHVLTSYWFVWIPAGLCLVLTVLGFNFVGDGLRDAFDPKMTR